MPGPRTAEAGHLSSASNKMKPGFHLARAWWNPGFTLSGRNRAADNRATAQPRNRATAQAGRASRPRKPAAQAGRAKDRGGGQDDATTWPLWP